MHYHLIGIAGTAMGSLAGLLASAGHRVTGSDQNVYPPMSDLLKRLGIDYAEGYAPANLEPAPDVVVVGNAISRGNPELEAALEWRLHYTSAANVIKEEFLRGRHVLAVAGTHGKTTTTSILAWVLESAGLNPSFLIGGVAENFGTSFRLTDSDFFVIEADEYDTAYFDKGPKMWHYLPTTAIVTNIEFDHADIYRDEEAYRFAFARFINLVPRTGTLVAGWDSPIVRELATKSWAPVEGYACVAAERGPAGAAADGSPRATEPARASSPDAGSTGAAAAPEILGASSTLSRPPLGPQPRWAADQVEFGRERTRFRVLRDGREWGTVDTPLAGAFNVRNALAVISAATAAGADRGGILEGLRTFRSVRRRMEVVGEARGITVIDDFAHHPTAVRETLDAAARRYAGRPVVAVFEPRSYTAQRREFQDAYVRAFGAARHVVLAGLFHPERYAEGTGIVPAEMVDAWRAQGKAAFYIPDVEDIVRHLARELNGGEVVVIMSNGGFGGIHGKLLEALRA